MICWPAPPCLHRPLCRPLAVAVAVVVALLGPIGCHWNDSSEAEEAEGEGSAPEPVAAVVTGTLEERSITEDILAYGVVVPGPQAGQTITAITGSQVQHVHVSQGQVVHAGDVLVDLVNSPDAQLELDQAHSEADVLAQRLEDAQTRLAQGLATNDEVLQARQEAENARLRFRSLRRRAPSEGAMVAPGAGVISHVYVSMGQILAPGDPIVDLDLRVDREVRLGVEPEDVGRLQENQPVRLRRPGVPRDAELTGVVRSVSNTVSEDTRLVPVLVSLPSDSGTLLNEFLVGTITLESGTTLVAPRSAVLPEGAGYVLYTVRDGHAVRHEVGIGMENDQEVEVLGDPELAGGDTVVVVGNAMLEDGMAVRPSTTEAPR